MKIAVCTSSHGFGHTARQLGLIERLFPRHQVTSLYPCPCHGCGASVGRGAAGQMGCGAGAARQFWRRSGGHPEWLEQNVGEPFIDHMRVTWLILTSALTSIQW